MKSKFPSLAASHSAASFLFLALCAIAFTAEAEDAVKYNWDAIVQYPQAPSPSTITEGNARFQVLSPTLIRMEYSPTARFVDEPSLAVINRQWGTTEAFTQKRVDGWLEIATGRMTVRYKIGSGAFTTDTLRVSWKDSTGDHAWKLGDADDKNMGGVPGDMAGLEKPPTVPGPLTRNGYFRLDDSRTALWDKAAGWPKPRPEKDSQDWYFFVYGQDYPHFLKELTKPLGPIPMPPRFIFGSWFGSRANYSGEQWKMIAEHFREERLPVDIFVLDSYSASKAIWAGYDRDLEQLPDPKGFYQWMKERGIKVLVNEHYGNLTPVNDEHFEAIRAAMDMPPETKEIAHNIAVKKYAELYMTLLHKPDLDNGMAFWWQDGNAGAGMEGLDPMMWTRHVEYQGMEDIMGTRPWIFCRYGAWGSHRYGSYFTGDLPGSWAMLDSVIPATIQGGNMLSAYMNNLCGGVANVDLPVEAYCRFVQFGSFSPVLWFHGFWGMRLPWEYGQEGIDTYRKFVGLRYALLPYTYSYARMAHESGLPLVRGLYLEYPDQDEAYTHNKQFLFGRELLVAPITQPASGIISNAGDFGQFFEGKPAKKDVFLPAGDNWYDFFTGRIYAGGQTISYDCPLNRMPLFVRAGSIIPMAPSMDSTDQKPVDPLTLDVYAGAATAEFPLYEDDGGSLAYRSGAYAWTTITLQSATGAASKGAGDYSLTIAPASGSFDGQLEKRQYIIRVHGLLKPGKVTLKGKSLQENPNPEGAQGWNWNEQERVVVVRLTKPLSVHKGVEIGFIGAGKFADRLNLEKAIVLREQVRLIKREMKLKHLAVTGGMDIKKPPRVIRETEKVERELDEMVRNPKGSAGTSPDFEAMREHVIGAMKDRPFEAERTIPEADPLAIDSTAKSKDATFTAEEIAKIASILAGK